MKNELKVIEVNILPDGRMDTRNAAIYTGLSEKTLAMHRSNGTGPKFIKPGRVYYFLEDLNDWLRSERVTSTAQLHRRQFRQ